jgi:hypothetical protein
MTFEQLKERHEALAKTVELLGQIMEGIARLVHVAESGAGS